MKIELKLSDSWLTNCQREQKILRLRYGLDGEGERSLQEVGNIFNLSRERIRQIMACAFNQLKSHKLLNHAQ
ncbi:TPA: hypothetical protein EYO57_24020 [Candidatus Poribacteria bacterium]|nr:hypothetical protein [Candidatus Poribacteria bacterium]